MRVMLDTNVLLAALVFRSQTLWKMMEGISTRHSLVLSSYVIDECYEVVERKKPALLPALDRFFEGVAFEMVYTPKTLPPHTTGRFVTPMTRRCSIRRSLPMWMC